MHCPTVLNKPKLKSGQTIIEIVLSIGLAAMVLSALLVLGAASSKTVAASLRRSQATKLAVQGMEAMRYYRDDKGYFQVSAGKCYTINSTGAIEAAGDVGSCAFQNVVSASGETGANNTFQRLIEVVAGGSEPGVPDHTKKVIVTVQWAASSTDTKDDVGVVKLVSLLSNW